MAPLLISLFLVGSTSSFAESSGGLIRKICMSSFAAAMQSAGQSPPEGMGHFTCNCFLEEVNSGTGLDEAQSRCKSRASVEYSME